MSAGAESKKKTTTQDTSIEESIEQIKKMMKEILWIVKQTLPKPKKK